MKKEDIEKAAREYKDFMIKENGGDQYDFVSGDIKDAFIAGAEWQSKQSPWISVEERLPESKEKVLVLNRMKHHDKYFVSENIYINWKLGGEIGNVLRRNCVDAHSFF